MLPNFWNFKESFVTTEKLSKEKHTLSTEGGKKCDKAMNFNPRGKPGSCYGLWS